MLIDTQPPIDGKFSLDHEPMGEVALDSVAVLDPLVRLTGRPLAAGDRVTVRYDCPARYDADYCRVNPVQVVETEHCGRCEGSGEVTEDIEVAAVERQVLCEDGSWFKPTGVWRASFDHERRWLIVPVGD